MALLKTDALLSPEGSSQTGQHRLAPRRFSTLDGVRLGLLGNSKLNADAVLLAVSDLLKERYALKSVFVRSKPSFGKPAPDEVVAEMMDNADVVVTGVGD
jgi:nucleotide-binding universal stress UspA family protein